MEDLSSHLLIASYSSLSVESDETYFKEKQTYCQALLPGFLTEKYPSLTRGGELSTLTTVRF